MINMISRTSITSMSGVVLMSTITSRSLGAASRGPVFIAIERLLSSRHPPRAGGSVMNATFVMPARWHA